MCIRDREGTVKQVLKDDRLIVEGVQIVKKHVRATQQGQQAGIVAVEAPVSYTHLDVYKRQHQGRRRRAYSGDREQVHHRGALSRECERMAFRS